MIRVDTEGSHQSQYSLKLIGVAGRREEKQQSRRCLSTKILTVSRRARRLVQRRPHLSLGRRLGRLPSPAGCEALEHARTRDSTERVEAASRPTGTNGKRRGTNPYQHKRKTAILNCCGIPS
ncbi:hypothetical protein NDU88_002778 [Pleurodeles waltl]|uniref:Uncharacterized protein n=1 Tax=Pleurodeles waltl TaxID=8319 RepID=A0AAV7P7Q7_PLEWA|nr:hypothetical protein NDU88_002778 [Pleurodeles waltl]